ncbi:MAG: Tad domain-containing protein [Acidimicrobiia bacterium]|nr:Tad domain-containing protein [Acidimicrobiia bacterium]
MTAILLVPLMLMAALAIDVGSWYVEAQQIQRAADAAALAGVTYMPDHFSDAQDKARDIAAKNGYVNGTNGVTVTATPVPGNRRRLKVTITNPHVRTFFGSIVTKEISITRAATAEYVVPVPLGSPRNYLGTGDLGKSTTTFSPEYLWASINGYCTDSEQGDERASFYSTATCSGATNENYSDLNYVYSVELPTTRTYSTDVILFDGNYRDGGGNADDDNPGGQGQPAMNTTFTLYQPDATILDDTDNPRMDSVTTGACSSTGAGHKGTKTFAPDTTEGGYTFNPSSTNFTSSSSWWLLCTIPASAPGGRYLLRVSNQDEAGGIDLTQGANNFSIVATPSSPQRLCDSRTDTTCPKVYANDYLSVRAASDQDTANFYLSEIGPEHKGKKVIITLWDPAEGGNSISIRKPTGTNTWTNQTFDWTSTNATYPGATNVSSIDVTGTKFNGQLLTISFTLPTTYAPPSDNDWWQIAYKFGGTDARGNPITVSDRTTWSVSILGDPVHLVG